MLYQDLIWEDSSNSYVQCSQCFELRTAAAAHVRDTICKYPQSHVVDRILRLIVDMANNKDKFTLRVTSLKALEFSMAVLPQRFMEE